MIRLLFCGVLFGANVIGAATLPHVSGDPHGRNDTRSEFAWPFGQLRPHNRSKIEARVLFEASRVDISKNDLTYLAHILTFSEVPKTADEYENLFFKKGLAIKAFAQILFQRPSSIFLFAESLAHLSLVGDSTHAIKGERLFDEEGTFIGIERTRNMAELRGQFIRSLEYFALVRPDESLIRKRRLAEWRSTLNPQDPLSITIEVMMKALSNGEIASEDPKEVSIRPNQTKMDDFKPESGVIRLSPIEVDLNSTEIESNNALHPEFLRILRLGRKIIDKALEGDSKISARNRRWYAVEPILEHLKSNRPVFFALPTAAVEIGGTLGVGQIQIEGWITKNLDLKKVREDFDSLIFEEVRSNFNYETQTVNDFKNLETRYGLSSFALRLKIQSWVRAGMLEKPKSKLTAIPVSRPLVNAQDTESTSENVLSLAKDLPKPGKDIEIEIPEAFYDKSLGRNKRLSYLKAEVERIYNRSPQVILQRGTAARIAEKAGLPPVTVYRWIQEIKARNSSGGSCLDMLASGDG